MDKGAATASKTKFWDKFDEGLTVFCTIMWGLAQFICTLVVLLAIWLEKYDAATAFGVLVLILRPRPTPPADTAASGRTPNPSDNEIAGSGVIK